MKKKKMHENQIFRWFTCGLSREKAAEVCFRSVRTITEWDNGKTIPPECRRLMEISGGIHLEIISTAWSGWKIRGNLIIAPNGETIGIDRLWHIVKEQEMSRGQNRGRQFAWYWKSKK